jgi:hypothetical protein
MTDIDTSKRAADMTESERQAFLQQCRKIAGAPKPPQLEPTKHAKDLSQQERDEWLANYRRSLK